MLDRLIDLALSALHLLSPLLIIREYSRGVVLRWGRYRRTLGPGAHWIWPLGIEECLQVNVVPDTAVIGPQSLTTRDGRAVLVSVVVTSIIEDPRAFLLDVEGQHQAIEDVTIGVISRLVGEHTWEELGGLDLANEIAKTTRRAAKLYGVGIRQVQIADWQQTRSFRILGSRIRNVG